MARLRRTSNRTIIAALAALICALTAVPACAVLTTVESTTVGFQPHQSQSVISGNLPSAATFSNPNGRAVVHSNNTFAIYWDPTDHYHGDWQAVIDGFFAHMAEASESTGTVYSVDAQYTDASNQSASYKSTFRGAYTDTDPYPTAGCTDPAPLQPDDAITCLTDAQIRTELEGFISSSEHNLPLGMTSIFYILTPPGVTVCLDQGTVSGHCSDYESPTLGEGETQEEQEQKELEGREHRENSFCSYHSYVSPTNTIVGDARTMLYVVVPWSAGGRGDYHLDPLDQTPGYDCQDGGFDPASKPIEEPERARELSSREQQELENDTPEARAAKERELELEGPRSQEPNQIGLGPDGSYDTGLADVIISQIGVEQQNVVTNPLLNAWQDSAGNEVSDECRNFFAPILGGVSSANEDTLAGILYNQSFGDFNAYINDTFNLAAVKLPYPAVPCLHGISISPMFTVQKTAIASQPVAFNGMESNITLNAGTRYSSNGAPEPTYATFTWDFGDGSAPITGYAPGATVLNSPAVSPCQSPWLTPCAASTFHSYQYGGTYTVTLTVHDVGGNEASVSQSVTVVGPAPPVENPPAGGQPQGAGNQAAGTNSQSASSSTSSEQTAVPDPLISTRIVSKSVRAVLRSGLAVRYSVNEQVAGHFELIMDARTAAKLRIHGSIAHGLPAGSPKSVVIATAILVTTQGGRSTARIKLSKRVVHALKGKAKVPLTVRLSVRNAQPRHPKTANSLSRTTLRR